MPGFVLKGIRAVADAAVVGFMLGACSITPLDPMPPPAGITTVSAPQLKAGNYWEYAVRDGYTGLPRGLYRYTVNRADASSVVLDLTRDGELVDTQVYTPDLKWLEHPLRNLQRFRYSPPYPAYAFPLYPGQHWRTVVNSTDAATGKTYHTHVHATVTGWHRIRVPAGEFDALEVRRQVYAGNMEFFRLQEEIVESDWYAPSIGFAVVSSGASSHIDTSRGGGGRRDPPLRVRGDWLIAELVRYSVQ
jgi:hypothetical protein